MSVKKIKTESFPGKVLPGIITRDGVIRPGDIWVTRSAPVRFFIISGVRGLETVLMQEIPGLRAAQNEANAGGLVPDMTRPFGPVMMRRVLKYERDIWLRISNRLYAVWFRSAPMP